MSTILLVLVAILALGFSFIKNKKKTIKSLQMAKGMFLKTAGDIIGVLALVALVLALVPESIIQSLLGNSMAY